MKLAMRAVCYFLFFTLYLLYGLMDSFIQHFKWCAMAA